MTIHDTERQRPKPVERCWFGLRLNVGFLQPLAKLTPREREAYARHIIRTNLDELTRVGFLTADALTAIKAESGDASNVVDMTKGAGNNG